MSFWKFDYLQNWKEILDFVKIFESVRIKCNRIWIREIVIKSEHKKIFFLNLIIKNNEFNFPQVYERAILIAISKTAEDY